jgi:hypothetical protein
MSLHTDTVAARHRMRSKAHPVRLRAARTPAAVRKRRQRANHDAGRYFCRGFWLSARAAEGLIMRLVLEQRLTEVQALDSKLVDQALAELLEEEGQRHAL